MAVKIHVFFGMDCPTFDLIKKEESIKKAASLKYGPAEVEVHCHHTSVALKSIFYDPKHLTTDKKTTDLCEKILEEARSNQYKKILVYGFSFGGAVVNRISEMFDTRVGQHSLWMANPMSKIQMATFGSAYIAHDPTDPTSFNENTRGSYVLINYIGKHDVALRVNKYTDFKDMDEPTIDKTMNYERPKHESSQLVLRNRQVCIKHCKNHENGYMHELGVHFGYGSLFYTLIENQWVDIDTLEKSLKPKYAWEEENIPLTREMHKSPQTSKVPVKPSLLTRFRNTFSRTRPTVPSGEKRTWWQYLTQKKGGHRRKSIRKKRTHKKTIKMSS